MIILFLPFLILFFITAKMVYLYAACLVLVPVLIGPFFETLFETLEPLGESFGGFSKGKGSIFWAVIATGTLVIYAMMNA